jgi:hypothetical protein
VIGLDAAPLPVDITIEHSCRRMSVVNISLGGGAPIFHVKLTPGKAGAPFDLCASVGRVKTLGKVARFWRSLPDPL